MITLRTLTLCALLKHFRVASGLTQDELAERARLSVRAISDLERGVRRAPHKDTLLLLAEALGLNEEDRALLLETARRSRGAGGSSASAATQATALLPDIPASLTPLTPLIGREREEAAVAHLLSRADVRLLTLTGPAGIGKTRLAQQVAASLRERFADGVVFVSLAAISEHALVLPAIAQALGVHEQASLPADERLRTYLAERELLLVLDNFEQIVRAGPDVVQILSACPRVKALVTSRAVLRVHGEQEFAVPPLDMPDLAHLPALDDLAQYAAIALFVHRAQAVRPTFELTPGLAPTVAAICVRLDGLPLAIELAAARIKLLSPQNVLKRLDPGLSLLTHGAQDLPERQQTMRRAIEWSYDLLDEREQRLFRCLAVFAGGWTLEAAEAVCSAPQDGGSSVLDGLTSLVDKSLVVRGEDVEGEPRFRLLELIREYGWEQLVAHDEDRALWLRHAEYYLVFAEKAQPELHGGDPAPWLARFSQEHANFRAALRFADEHDKVDLGLRFGAALWRFWQLHGHLQEGRAWLDRFLSRPQSMDTAAPADDSKIRAEALKGAGNLAWYQWDYEPARALLEESLAHFRRLGNAPGVAHVLNTLGLIADGRGESVRARVLYEECLALRRQLGDMSGIACVLNNLGDLACRQEQYATAISLYEESVSLHHAAGDRHGRVVALGNLGTAMLFSGDLRRAEVLLDESLALYTELGDRGGVTFVLTGLGALACARDEFERAARLYRDGLALARELGSKIDVVEILDGAAEVACANGRTAQAIRRVALASELRERYQMPRSPGDQTRRTAMIGVLHAALGDEAFAAEWAAGRAMTLERALADFEEGCP